jgi:hypothetical protein
VHILKNAITLMKFNIFMSQQRFSLSHFSAPRAFIRKHTRALSEWVSKSHIEGAAVQTLHQQAPQPLREYFARPIADFVCSACDKNCQWRRAPNQNFANDWSSLSLSCFFSLSARLSAGEEKRAACKNYDV